MALSQALQLGEARVEGHRGVVGVLRQVQVRRATQLFLDHERLLQQLEERQGTSRVKKCTKKRDREPGKSRNAQRRETGYQVSYSMH